MNDTQRTVKGRLIALLVGAICTILVAEGATRLFYDLPPQTIHNSNLIKAGYQHDDELVWIPRRNVQGIHDKTGSFSTTFRTNSRGLRDKEYTLEKSAGVKRIVVIGDSHTWGYGVNNDEIYTERLESLLPNTEVINLGVTGFNNFKEINYFKREGTKYDPDMLILGFTLNDMLENLSSLERQNLSSKPESQGPMESKSEKASESFFLSVKRFLGTHSVLYLLVIERINTNKSLVKVLVKVGLKDSLDGWEVLDTNLAPALVEYPQRLTAAWTETKAKLSELKKLAIFAGVELVVAVIPSRQTINNVAFQHSIAYTEFDETDFDLDKPYELLKAYALAENIRLVNPVAAFRQAHNMGEVLYLKRDVHMTPAGHDLLAREIGKYLLGESL
jgi:hypothetical protein